MAAGISGSAQFTNTLPKFIEEARLTLSQVGVMKQAIETIPLKKESGLTLNIPTWTQPTAYTLTEGVDMAQAQQMSDANVGITVAENAGVQVILTKLAMSSMREDMMRKAATSMANAVENKRDDDLITLLAGFTTNTIGSAGTSLALGHIMAAKARLQASSRPLTASIQGVFHPYMLHALYEDFLSIVGGSFGNVSVPVGSVQDDIIKNYDVFDVAGIKVWSDPLIVADGSDDATAGLYAKDALIYVPYEDEDIEDEYDSSLRGYEINMVATYGYGEYLDAHGFAGTFDMAAPAN